jgi:GMP synthase-like glutamine amidotransferase
MQTDKPEIKAAIIDLYQDYPNQEIRNFQDLLEQYKAKHHVNLTYQVFDLRGKNEIPDLDFDLYLSSGGPGSPVDTEGSEWERLYWQLIDTIDAHNRSAALNKKHVLFVCHSFQLMCRRLKLGNVTMRHAESFGIFPVYLTSTGLNEPLFDGLADPLFIVDSREWQVINPDHERFAATGARLLALEKEHLHAAYPRAMMAIRFNDYFFGTQFHPEVDPELMRANFTNPTKKQQVIAEYGQASYNDILAALADPEKVKPAYQTIIPRFIYMALQNFRQA